jgi:hypothetical protein
MQGLAQEWRDRVFDFATASGCLRSAFAFIALQILSVKIRQQKNSPNSALRNRFSHESVRKNLLNLPLAIIQIPANLPRILHGIREIDSRPPESLRSHLLQLLKFTLRRIQATRTANSSVTESVKIAKGQKLTPEPASQARDPSY